MKPIELATKRRSDFTHAVDMKHERTLCGSRAGHLILRDRNERTKKPDCLLCRRALQELGRTTGEARA